jgi:DNA polymerase-3 subunit delta'
MWQVLGQDKVVALLERSLKENIIAHAYLFVGPHHVGKKTLALNLAQALNCSSQPPPCSQCRSCHRILDHKHADVISIGLPLIKSGARTEISIDDIRELQKLANLPPYEGKYKVFIIDDAEYLSTEAANSLLKILEEPPPKVVWLLLAAEERRLLPTIISRCQRLELKPLPLPQVQKILVDSYQVDLVKAKFLARLSQGCLGWALSALADDNILKERAQVITMLSSLTRASLEQRFAYAQEFATQFSQNRKSVEEIMEIWLRLWRDLMLIKGGCKEAVINVDYEMALEEQANSLSLNEIKWFLASLGSLWEEISKNVNPRLAFESLMLNMPGGEIAHGQDRGFRKSSAETRRGSLN